MRRGTAGRRALARRPRSCVAQDLSFRRLREHQPGVSHSGWVLVLRYCAHLFQSVLAQPSLVDFGSVTSDVRVCNPGEAAGGLARGAGRSRNRTPIARVAAAPYFEPEQPARGAKTDSTPVDLDPRSGLFASGLQRICAINCLRASEYRIDRAQQADSIFQGLSGVEDPALAEAATDDLDRYW